MISKRFNKTFREIFNACKVAIQKCGFNIESFDEKDGYIYASSPPSIFSWGEDITVEIRKISPDETSVKVESMPKAQLFDWGKSRENERRIMEILENILR